MRRFALVLLVLMFLVLTTPTYAAETVTALPELKQPLSGRIDGVFLINASIAQYGQAEWMGDRFHAVFVNRETGLIEVVTIGNHVFFRHNQETRWQATTLDQAEGIPARVAGVEQVPTEHVTIVRVGDVEVNGSSTLHYQVVLDVAAVPADAGLAAFKADAFIGKNDSYLHKLQFTVRTTDAQMGTTEVIGLNVYSAFDRPVLIGPPPDSLVDRMSTRDVARYLRFPGASRLPLWARPIVGHAYDVH